MNTNIQVKLYRVAKVHTAQLKGACGLELDSDNQKASEELKKRFGPHFAHGFKVFWPEVPAYSITLVGMEAMAFDVKSDKVPCAGVVQSDPLDDHAVSRLDGMLLGELSRLGIYYEHKDVEWRMYYSVKS